MKKVVSLLIIFIPLLLPTTVFAANSSDVLINEFSPKSDPEWIELYNPKNQQISIAGWKLRDAANHSEDLAPVCIPPQGFYTFERPKGWLNDSNGDKIDLLDESGAVNIIDNVSYGNPSDHVPTTPASDKSASRVPDGSDTWQVDEPTRQDTSIPCPSNQVPSPTPSSTPKATPTPTPKSTSSSSTTSTKKSPSPSPQINKNQSSSPSSSPQVLGQKDLAQGFVDLAASDILNSPSPEPSTYDNPFNKNVSKILIGAGILFIIVSSGVYLWYKRSLGQESTLNKGNERFEEKEE